MDPLLDRPPRNAPLLERPGLVPYFLGAVAVIAAFADDRKDGFLRLGMLVLAGFLFLSSAILHAARKA